MFGKEDNPMPLNLGARRPPPSRVLVSVAPAPLPARARSRPPSPYHRAAAKPRPRSASRDTTAAAASSGSASAAPARAHGDLPPKRWPNTLAGVTNPAHITKRCTSQESLASICELLETGGDFVHFDPICLAAAINRLGKLAGEASKKRIPFPATLPDIFSKLVDKAESMLSTFDGRHISNMLHGIAVSGFFSLASLQDTARRLYSALVDEFEARRFQPQLFSPQAIANITWSLATVEWDSTVFGSVCALMALIPTLHEFKPQEISNLCWALSKVGHRDFVLFDRVAAEVPSRRFVGFNPQNISNLIWAMATIEYHNDDFFKAAFAHMDETQLSTFNAQDLSNLAWSLAHLQLRNGEFLERLANASRAKMRQFEAQHISNTVWAYSKLGINSTLLFAAVTQELMTRNLSVFEPPQLANVVWAFATLGIPAMPVFQRIAEHCTARGFDQFEAQAMANIVWAFAKAGIKFKSLNMMFARVSEHLVRHGFDGFKTSELSHLVWSYATLGIEDQELFVVIANHCLHITVKYFSPGELANLSWAFATFKINHTALFTLFTYEIVTRDLGTFSLGELSNIAWACSVVGVFHLGLLEGIAVECRQRPWDSFSMHSIAHLLWALACCEMLGNEQVRALFARDELIVLGDRTLTIAKLLNDVAVTWRTEVGGEDPPLLRRLFAGHWIETLLASDGVASVSSPTVLALAHELTNLGYVCYPDYRVVDGISVDLLVRRSGQHSSDGGSRGGLGIELVGPGQLLSDGATLSGKVALKHRLLAKLLPEFFAAPMQGAAALVVDRMSAGAGEVRS